MNKEQEEVRTYLSEFVGLRCHQQVLKVVSPLGPRAEKEISESMAVIKRLRALTINAPPQKFALYDFCAGNALTSVLAACLLPVRKVVAYDKRVKNRNWHLVRDFTFERRNINKLDPREIEPESIIISIHPCGEKARRVGEIFLRSPARHLILMPCCVGDLQVVRYPESLIKSAGKEMLWAIELAFQVNGRITVDKKCLSGRNAIVMANKDKPVV